MLKSIKNTTLLKVNKISQFAILNHCSPISLPMPFQENLWKKQKKNKKKKTHKKLKLKIGDKAQMEKQSHCTM